MIPCMCTHVCIHVLLVHAHVSLYDCMHACTCVHFMYTYDFMCGRVQPSWASWYNYTFNVISTFLPSLVLDLSACFFPFSIRQLNQLLTQQHLPVGVLQNLDLLPKLQILRWTRLHSEQGTERRKFIWSVEQCWARSSGGGNWGAEKENGVPAAPGRWRKKQGQPELGRKVRRQKKKK